LKHIKRIVAVTIVAWGSIVGTSTITATTDTDEMIVAAMPPDQVLITHYCMEPTRTNLAAARTDCDLGAEKHGYTHGVLRPINPNDEFDGQCTSPEELYLCIAVGPR